MSRLIGHFVVGFGLISCAVAPLGYSQTNESLTTDIQPAESQDRDSQNKDSPNQAGPNRPDQPNSNQPNSNNDRRLNDALLDIRLLKRVVDDQARRITDLEKIVKALEAAVISEADKTAENRGRIPGKPFMGPKWQNPYAWGQINKGMSRVEVEEILGPPTTVDSVIDYQTLHYIGPAAGGERLEGTVKFTDDRVTEMIVPEF